MKAIIITLIVLGIIGGGIYWLNALPEKLGQYDAFVSCLSEKGAIFYGAFWCPHCQNQKGFFGRSAPKLPYVECSTPNGQGQLAVCQDKNITSYPTWDFADGERMTGEIPLEVLAQKTGCQLPPAN